MAGRLFSLRMHASARGEHLCGAERIVPARAVALVSERLLARALGRSGPADRCVRLAVDPVEPAEVRRARLLRPRTLETSGPDHVREAALEMLASAGVSAAAAATALEALRRGPGPGGRNMRGAMLVHSVTAERLEPDAARGVRVTRMDLAPEAREGVRRALRRAGLDHFRVLEALILASKAAAVQGVAAELCVSDDPDYTTGYVASDVLGYVRLPGAKEPGRAVGGRALFVVPGRSVPELIRELEEVPYLLEEWPRDV